MICTKNRCLILRECLSSLVANNFTLESFEVLVIDNGSIDGTKEEVYRFRESFEFIHYYFEERIGLSIARNTGINKVRSPWVVFLDDDSKPAPDFLWRFHDSISKFNFDGIGGVFYPWYSQGPVAWIPSSVIQFPVLRSDRGPLLRGTFVAGGISAFKKEWLERVGLFPENIGMRGDIVGYGEENEVQERIWKLGGEIWFDPDWRIAHYVAPYKYEIKWHVKRLIGKGRDYQSRIGQLTNFEVFKLFLNLSFTGAYHGIFNSMKFIFKKSYPWQMWFLDSFSFSLMAWGRILSNRK
ncbi:glycosyltransferase family 2 protein [Algoriphagus yeomjeoni]|uniref:GT2 family glycosyltransferase n=1 Tax=Algoriphagus yeomjeoni TaxID=291403 RepID=A0A327P200_9BACT|nr:glycosyltransferase family 2 protein [Algoriphagus yeomjeoni]RAI85591.1 GT2 family glycosyltransferase [Algoriphagus yeomjeoni]